MLSDCSSSALTMHTFDDEIISELPSCVYASQHFANQNTNLRLSPNNLRQIQQQYLQHSGRWSRQPAQIHDIYPKLLFARLPGASRSSGLVHESTKHAKQRQSVRLAIQSSAPTGQHTWEEADAEVCTERVSRSFCSFKSYRNAATNPVRHDYLKLAFFFFSIFSFSAV